MDQAAIASMLSDDFLLLQESRNGMSRESFSEIAKAFPFRPSEWQQMVDLEKPFEQMLPFNGALAERILLIAQVSKRGEEVFGSFELFVKWLETPIPALGGQLPKSMLNNYFGLSILKDELGRIEHGLFA